MHIPNRDDLFKETDEIKNEEVKSKIIHIYNYLVGDKDLENPKIEVYNVLELLFKNEFTEQFSIPIKFLNTTIGTVLFTVLYCKKERTYTITEAAKLLGITRQRVWMLRNELNAYKDGRVYKIKKSDLEAYKNKKRL